MATWHSSVTVKDVGVKLTSQQIADAEHEIGFKLPPDYIEFLLSINGGNPSPNYIQVEIDGVEPWQPVDYVGGLRPEDIDYDILWSSRVLWNRAPEDGPLPRDMLHLCFNADDNDIMLSLGPDRFGAVWLKAWALVDQEDDYDSAVADPECHLYKICDSFAEFLDRLEHNPEFENEPD